MKLAFITKRGECVLDLSQIAPSVAGVAGADSANRVAGVAGTKRAQDLLEAQIAQCARESGILNAKNLILFFGGFGSSPAMFSHLLAQNGGFGGDCSGGAGKDFDEDFGIIMCYKYDDIAMLRAPQSAPNITLAGALESALACIFGAFGAREKADSSGILRADSSACKIDSCMLIGFSMGVCVGAKILAQSPSLAARISKAIAINGSNAGIHDTFGIKARIFAHTAKLLDIEVFASALFGEDLAESKNAESTPESKKMDSKPESKNADSSAQMPKLAQKFRLDSDTSALKKELLCLQEFCASEQNLAFTYDIAIISRQDKIFPPQANSAFFAQMPTAIRYIDAPHFAFSHFKSWGEICAI